MSDFTEILFGMQIIEEFDQNPGYRAEYNQIWCGDPEKASDEQKKKLDELGWFISEDSFSHWG